MPYTAKTVPRQVNTKTAEQKKVFSAAFNAALADGKSEQAAFRIANAAASKVGGEKKDKDGR